MSGLTRLHVDDGNCWCESEETSAPVLDATYPDRCQQIGGLLSTHPTCVKPADHDGPCHGGTERAGDPCHYCGTPTPSDDPCPLCWVQFTNADLKAMAAEAGRDTTLRPDGTVRTS